MAPVPATLVSAGIAATIAASLCSMPGSPLAIRIRVCLDTVSPSPSPRFPLLPTILKANGERFNEGNSGDLRFHCGFPVQRWQKAFVRMVACLVYRAERISRNVDHRQASR